MDRKKTMKQMLSALLCLALLLTGFSGCSQPENGETTLWVVTEQSPVDGMNYQTEEAIKRLQEAHENVTVTLEVLPTEEGEREIRLRQLRAMIPTGKGPDVYLLPVSNTLLLTEPEPYTATAVEALFPDVTMAMYNGLFADISAFYDADEDLGKEALNTTVMDAGVLGGARYVLPLRYNLPLIYTSPELWEAWDLTREDFDAGVAELLEMGLAREEELFVRGLSLPDDFSLLPQIFDYESGRLLLTQEDLTEYIRLYQARMAFLFHFPHGYSTWMGINSGDNNSLANYIANNIYWYRSGFPLYSGSLADAMTAAVIAKMRDYELAMFPLRATDGSVVAEVTYYGAVGSGCAQPGLAYEFLRMFLTEEFQWDGVRPRMEKGPKGSQKKEPQRKGMVEDSWPVRTVGSVEPLWDNVLYQYLYFAEAAEVDYSFGISASMKFRSRHLQEYFLADADIPALEFEIDEVRFPIVQAEEETLSNMLDKLFDKNSDPVDFNAMADELLLNLWWHLAEG